MATSRLPSSPRIVVVVAGLALALSGCLTTQPPPNPEAPFADRLVVHRGVVDGVAWSVHAARQDARICSFVTVGDGEQHRLACSDLGPGPVNFRGAWFAGAVPLILFRLVEPNVATVRLLVEGEEVVVRTASLAPMGINLAALAVAFPAGARVEGLVYLASDGTELSRHFAAIEVPEEGGGDAATFVDGDATIDLGWLCGAGNGACVVQVGPDR